MHAVCEPPATSWRFSQTVMTPTTRTPRFGASPYIAPTALTVLEEEQPFSFAVRSHTIRNPNALPALQNLEATAVTIEQWRLVGFIVEEANLNKHSNNKYTIIIIFLNILYRVPQNSRNSLPVRC
jgi:hypothetical protein